MSGQQARPWWVTSLGYGVGGALVAAVFSRLIFDVGMLVLPLSDATFEKWADAPPVGLLCLIVGVAVALFAAGLEFGGRQSKSP